MKKKVEKFFNIFEDATKFSWDQVTLFVGKDVSQVVEKLGLESALGCKLSTNIFSELDIPSKFTVPSVCNFVLLFYPGRRGRLNFRPYEFFLKTLSDYRVQVIVVVCDIDTRNLGLTELVEEISPELEQQYYHSHSNVLSEFFKRDEFYLCGSRLSETQLAKLRDKLKNSRNPSAKPSLEARLVRLCNVNISFDAFKIWVHNRNGGKWVPSDEILTLQQYERLSSRSTEGLVLFVADPESVAALSSHKLDWDVNVVMVNTPPTYDRIKLQRELPSANIYFLENNTLGAEFWESLSRTDVVKDVQPELSRHQLNEISPPVRTNACLWIEFVELKLEKGKYPDFQAKWRNHNVAVRMIGEIRTNEELIKFKNHVQAFAALEHPNIARVLAACREPAAIISEDFVGPTLNEYLASKLQISDIVAIKICQQICDGMAYLTSQSVVHPDFGAHNIRLNTTTMELKIVSIFSTHPVDEKVKQRDNMRLFGDIVAAIEKALLQDIQSSEARSKMKVVEISCLDDPEGQRTFQDLLSKLRE
eukprot:TRINITY_DN4730_c0_g1_i3.p1 TRINITY_DN4730_c0_g1~~TRINITY_DN4730_c0_g1_i3.p1  ORF type:complete len:533 (+),score=74.72 TRINITY_DN4730_c0_g1_i3:55-1653(+)